MGRKKRNKYGEERRGGFGWKDEATWNQARPHKDKSESKAYSPKVQGGRKKSPKAFCSPEAIGQLKQGSGARGRPVGYVPAYSDADTYNYKSEAARYVKALDQRAELRAGKIAFYRGSTCAWHCVIPPDITFEEIRDVWSDLPPEFRAIAPPEFWINFPRPAQPTPGQLLFPIGGSEGIDLPRFGCTRKDAENYDPNAEIDDGSCILDEAGCTDPNAENYDPFATYDNGSCKYPEDDEDQPEDPCEPANCYLGPQYDSRWISVNEEQALSGQGCPIGYTNNGYALLSDGSYQVLCTFVEAEAESFQRMWYRFPGEDWNLADKVTSLCWNESTEELRIEGENSLTIPGERPEVIGSCSKPGTDVQPCLADLCESLIGSFAIVSYQWGPQNGRDLDTRTKLLVPDFGGDVGWARGSTVSGPSGAYLAWQGDNTGTSGSEDVYIYFENLSADYPALTEFKVRMRAFWYGEAADGKINLKTRVWADFESFQNGDNPTAEIDRAKELTSSAVGSNVDGETIAIMVFNNGEIFYE
jgi:hypothetical protein